MRHRSLKLISLAVICVAAVITGSIALGQISATDDYLVEYLADIAEHPGYLLRDIEGYLGVYYEGRGYPVFISHIPVSSLHGQDRIDAKRGVFVATRQELIALLEDWGS